MIYVKKILLLLSLSLIYSQSDTLKWKHYGRIGLSNAQSQNGAFGYYRLNRKTDDTFRDLRLFAYNLQNESFVYLRYKSSDKYSSNSKFYRYTTSFFRKNSQANLDLQYHVNQGLGIFLNQYENGLINVVLHVHTRDLKMLEYRIKQLLENGKNVGKMSILNIFERLLRN